MICIKINILLKNLFIYTIYILKGIADSEPLRRRENERQKRDFKRFYRGLRFSNGDLIVSVFACRPGLLRNGEQREGYKAYEHTY